MRKIQLLCVCTFMQLSGFAAYTGSVYVDANRNGVYDKGERGVKNVMVSDGLHVVKTGADGSYTLPGHPKEKFLFITTPSGYKTDNAYYHRITKERTQYDFALRAYDGGIGKRGEHRFVQISDTEISDVAGHDDWVANVRNYAANEEAAFVIHTGDICYEGGLKSHIKLMNTANMNTQIFYCIGNHDLVKGEYGEELFESLYGPTFYSFDAGSVHYIVTPMLGGDYRPAYKKEDVYRWLKNDLAQVPAGKPIMVFNHDILTTGEDFIYGINEKEFINLDEHNLKAWIYGHWHINHIKKHKKAYSVCTSTLARGGIDHSTSAFRVMKIDERGDFISELRYTYIDKALQINSLQNEGAPLLVSGKVPLSVNAYSTVSPVTNVSCLCTVEGKRIASVNALQQQTDFNWYGEIALPEQYKGRFVTVTVEARFANGEVAKTEQSFVYSQAKQTFTSGTDWCNLLGNPEHIGIAADTLTTPLSLAWVRNIGSNVYMTSPIVCHNSVFVASIDENKRGRAAIVALDAQTGDIRWKYSVRSSVKNTIAATNGLVFAQDVDGYLYAVDAVSGRLAWEKKLDVRVIPTLIEGLVTSDGIVYAGSGNGLCALEAATGREIWKNTSWGQHEGSTATLSLGDGVLIGSTQWGALYANDAKNGKKLWSVSKEGIRNRASSAAMHHGVLYIVSDKSLFLLSPQTGQILANKVLPYSVDVTSTPLVTDKEIIFGSSAYGMIALHRETFDLKWTFMTGDAMIYTAPYVRNPASMIETSPVLSGNTVFFGASDGVFYALDRTKGSLLWRHVAGAPIMSSMAISGKRIFGVDYAGNVYAFVEKK